MTWVKVCGLTRESDVVAAVDAGADALGFVLAPRSPRAIDTTRAAALMDGVPALRILVTVDTAAGEMSEAVAATGADGIQPHGAHADEAARWAQARGLTLSALLVLLAHLSEASTDQVRHSRLRSTELKTASQWKTS